MNSLFSESAMGAIKKTKKGFLWAAVCILIGEVVVGAILILIQSFDETIGKLMGTFALCAVMMFFGVNNFSRMEKHDRIVQSFALVGLISNITWLLLSFFVYLGCGSFYRVNRFMVVFLQDDCDGKAVFGCS